MSNCTVVAKLVAKKECVEQVKEELVRMVEPTRREEGCIEYRLHQDKADPALFIFYENWESLAHLEKHTTTDHYITYASAVKEMIDTKAVHKMTEIA